MERPPLGGEGYQRDVASSRFTHFDTFTKNWISIFSLKLIILVLSN